MQKKAEKQRVDDGRSIDLVQKDNFVKAVKLDSKENKRLLRQNSKSGFM